MCACNDDSPPVFENNVYRKARKRHRCCECDCPIEIGETYKETTGLWEDSFGRFRTCLECDRIGQRFKCFEFQGMHQALIDCGYLARQIDEKGEDVIYKDKNGRRRYIYQPCVDWLQVVSQHPLKCVVVQ